MKKFFLSSLFILDGPVWIDKINDLNFVRLLLQEITSEKTNFQFKTKKKIIGLLYGILYVNKLNSQLYLIKRKEMLMRIHLVLNFKF